jgi:transglutaminase-like putative cysteine protease
MQIRAGFEISYECLVDTPMALLLNVHSSRRDDLITPDTLKVDPAVPVTQHVDMFGNVVSRLVAPAGRLTVSSDFLIHDIGVPDEVAPGAGQVAVEDLPDVCLPFLLGSRYGETDQLGDLAWSLFGGARPGWERVQAIVDYVHQRIEFGYQHACKTRTAREAHEERRGVCRDFAHLAVTLCRCMNIPARYCTGYLGDIGVEPIPAPMDFSAWFEAYLGGRWYAFDARHNRPRIGRIVLARGRDATDAAISTAFGAAMLTGFEVLTEEVRPTGAFAAAVREMAAE